MSERAAQAAATRQRVIAAAAASFFDGGYGASTIKGIATAATVSPETIYKTFGTKAALLKAVYDVVLAGDDDELPISERPGIHRVAAQTSPLASARAYAQFAVEIDERVGPLVLMAAESRGNDPELRVFGETIEEERAAGTLALTRHWHDAGFLRRGIDPEHARDIVWLLIAPETMALLRRRGWSREAYVDWFVATLAATLLAPDTETGGRPSRVRRKPATGSDVSS